MAHSRAQTRQRRVRRRRDERGSASLELVILFPAVLLLIFGVVQGGLYFHARSVAMAAAQQGVRAAAAEDGSAEAGGSEASAFVAQAGGSDVMTGVRVSPQRTPTAAKVTVTGRPLSVIPGVMNFQVSQTAELPVERFTDPGGRP